MSYGQVQTQQPMAGQQMVTYGQQPPVAGGINWMPAPVVQGGTGNPALNFLASVDQLVVKQKKEMIEIFTGFESANKYEIRNAQGQTIFMAMEENDCCTRNMCGNMRPFDLKIIDAYQQEVMSFYRPLNCTGCCFPCCLQKMDVMCPPGNVIGSVEEEWSFMIPNFAVKNAAGETVLKIKGPCWTCACFSDVEFEVLSADGATQVGKISKKWVGFLKETFTDADTFGINFPFDLDMNVKGTLLGALFLIDFLYFEQPNN